MCCFNINHAQRGEVSTKDSTKFNKDLISLSFVGSGNFEAAFLEGTKTGSNAGLGMIFFRKWSKNKLLQDINLDLYISVAGSSDTLHSHWEDKKLVNRKDFGQYLLQPYNSKQAANFNLLLYLDKSNDRILTKVIHGISAQFYASNTTATFQEEKIDLTGLAIRLGLFHDFIPIPSQIRYRKGYSIVVGVDYSFRGLFGDIIQDENTVFRHAILGTDRTHFHGSAFYFGFQLKNIRAEVRLPIFGKRGGEVSGLTNTQFITSLRFVGGFPVFIEGYEEGDSAVRF